MEKLTLLDKVKTILSLHRSKQVIQESELSKVFKVEMAVNFDYLIKQIETKFNFKLGQKTTPKKLYNKVYKELSKEEKSEYTQIKRLIKRGKDSYDL